MQFTRLSVALVTALIPATVLATNGDQIIALSAPAAAMGGATVTTPRDALTVLHNLAGLAHLVGAEGGKDIDEMRSNVACTHAFDNKVISSTTTNSIEMSQYQLSLNVTYVF